MSTDLFAPSPEASAPSDAGTPDVASVPSGEETLAVSMDETLHARLAELNAEDGDASNEDGRTDASPPVRGADGKFVARDAKADAPGDEPVHGEEGKAPAETFKDVGPPKSWRPSAKALWDTLPQELKDESYKRENDFFKGTETYRAKANVADALMQEISPFNMAIRAAGADIPTAIREVFGAAATLQLGTPSQKAATLQRLAVQYGVDLNQVVSPQGHANEFADPALDAANTRIGQLEKALGQIIGNSQNSETARAQAMLSTFESNPANRYYPDVRNMMGVLISSGQAGSLEDAYTMACRTHPGVFAAMQAEARAQQDKERQADAAKARRLGNQSVRSMATPGKLVTPATSMEETLRSAYREIQSR